MMKKWLIKLEEIIRKMDRVVGQQLLHYYRDGFRLDLAMHKWKIAHRLLL